MSKTSRDYIEEARQQMGDLANIKQVLHSQLSDVKVKVSKVEDAELYNSIVAVFGEQNSENVNYCFITLDMFMHCLDIIRLSGKEKGRQILTSKGI